MSSNETLMWKPGRAPGASEVTDEQGPKSAIKRIHAVSSPAGPSADDTIVTSIPFGQHEWLAALPTSTLPLTEVAAIPAEPERAAKTREPLFRTMKLNKLIVSSYKLMGFAILGTILLGLASFIFINLFYLANHSWVTPMVISLTDPRVLQLDAQYEADKAARDGVATQRLQLVSQLEDARRVQASEEQFQASFQDAMKAEATDRGTQLSMLQRLLGDLKRTRSEVAATGHDYTAVSKESIQQEYAAGLIGKDAATRGGYELSQIAGANLALHEKNVEIDAHVSELRRAIAAMGTGKSTSYEVLHMQHEFEQSVLASQRARGDVGALAKSVAMVEETIAGYETQLARIEKAPYRKAADASVTTAFVPYDNIGAVALGDGVYGCAIGVLWCKRVGRVAEVLDGEVVQNHPLHNREMRGVLVRLEVDDATAVQRPVLHLHRPPLGL